MAKCKLFEVDCANDDPGRATDCAMHRDRIIIFRGNVELHLSRLAHISRGPFMKAWAPDWDPPIARLAAPDIGYMRPQVQTAAILDYLRRACAQWPFLLWMLLFVMFTNPPHAH